MLAETTAPAELQKAPKKAVLAVVSCPPQAVFGFSSLWEITLMWVWVVRKLGTEGAIFKCPGHYAIYSKPVHFNEALGGVRGLQPL